MAPRTLAAWPYRERWAGVVLAGQRVGFTRLALAAQPDAQGLWRIESEAALRLRFLGLDKSVHLRAEDFVRDDFALARFRYRYELDGSVLRVEGSVEHGQVRIRIETSAGAEERVLAHGAAVYPQSAIALLPVARGLRIGLREGYAVLVGETQHVAEAEMEVSGFEASELLERPAFRVVTRLLGMETVTWIAPDGQPLLERALGGALIAAHEPEAEARRYLVSGSLARDEALLAYSRLPAPPLEAPERIEDFEIELSGVPEGLPTGGTPGQRCERRGERLTCRIERGASDVGDAPTAKDLRPSLAVPSGEGEIVSLARAIAADARSDAERIARLLAWMEAHIAREAADAFSATDVLRARKGDCQGQAMLLAAFARALGMPARLASGIVYSPVHGAFLYHAWNEVWIAGEGWRLVDPALGQTVADATHLKLAGGETPAALLPLAPMIGRARIETVRVLRRSP